MNESVIAKQMEILEGELVEARNHYSSASTHRADGRVVGYWEGKREGLKAGIEAVKKIKRARVNCE